MKMSTQRYFNDLAWAVPQDCEVKILQKFVVRFDHPRCNYGQPILVSAGGGGYAKGEVYGPADLIGGIVQHNGPHKASLAAAGYHVVESAAESLGWAEEARAR